MVNFDAVFEKTGEFGRYQKFMVFLLCLPCCFMNSYVQFSWVFMFYTPEHHCHVSLQLLANYTQAGFQLDVGKCSIKLYRNDSLPDQEVTNEIPCPQGWDYDRSQFKESIVSRWDLVCDQAFKPKTVLAVRGLVTIVGCLFLSMVQDQYGRKPCFYLCLLLYVIGTFCSLLTPNLLTYAIVRCSAALTAISSWNVGFIWCMEIVGPSKRTLVSTTLAIMYCAGSVSLAGLAYVFDTWFQFGLVTSLPFIALLSYRWLLVESPRWLVSARKSDGAKTALRKIVERNGRRIEDKELEQLMNVCYEETSLSGRRKGTVVDLFRGPQLRWKTLLLTAVWIGNALIYNTLAFNVENITNNFYFMYSLQAAVEAPAVLLNLVALNRIGRILPLFLAMMTSGFCCLLTAVPNLSDYLVMFVALLAKFGICLSYTIIYQVASELFPTVVRGVGNGFGAVVAAAAVVVMPSILYASTIHKSLPMLILGFITLVCGTTALFLPETLGLPMAETLEEGELYGKVGMPALRSHLARISQATVCRVSTDAQFEKNFKWKEKAMFEEEKIRWQSGLNGAVDVSIEEFR